MIDPLRRLVNRAYLAYKDHVPVARGKYRLGKTLHDLFGRARYTVDGFEYELHPVSVIDEKLIRGIPHDEIVTEQLKEHVRPGDYVVDVGANIGLFTLQASPMVGPQGRVYAFEPSPREFARLLRHIELNQLTNVVPISSGLSSSIGDLIINLALMGNTGQNSLYPIPTGERQARCHVAPLRSFMSDDDLRKVALMKIDVEGAELHVLRGFDDLMPLMFRTVFVVEIAVDNLALANETPAAIYKFFEQHGYRPRIGLHEAHVYDEVFETRNRLSR